MYSARFEEALGQFYAVHQEDPRTVEVEGRSLPWSVFYHRRLSFWVHQVASAPPEEMALAAACQHIRRWRIPREDYPEGREGYKQWRSDLAKFHSKEASQILDSLGYPESVLERVSDFLEKRRFKADPEVQLFEDAICLTFLETEFADFAEGYDREQLWRIVERTWKKMSPVGHDEAVRLAEGLPWHLQDLIQEVASSSS